MAYLSFMKTLIILMSFLLTYPPQENACKVDITDLVVPIRFCQDTSSDI